MQDKYILRFNNRNCTKFLRAYTTEGCTFTFRLDQARQFRTRASAYQAARYIGGGVARILVDGPEIKIALEPAVAEEHITSYARENLEVERAL